MVNNRIRFDTLHNFAESKQTNDTNKQISIHFKKQTHEQFKKQSEFDRTIRC